VIVLLIRCYLGDQLKKTEMGGACSMCGREEKCIQCFGGAKKEGTIWKNQVYMGDNTKMDLNKNKFLSFLVQHFKGDRILLIFYSFYKEKN